MAKASRKTTPVAEVTDNVAFVVTRRAVFWTLAAIFAVVFLWLFRSILLPFLAGGALAYLLDPVADWLERKGMSRVWATVTILVTFMFMTIFALLLIIPSLVSQLANFIDYLPTLIQDLRARLVELVNWARTSENALVQRLFGEGETALEGLSGELFGPDVIGQITNFGTKFFVGVISSGSALFNSLSLLVVTPVVAFYLLLDWDNMMARLDKLLPRDHKGDLRRIGREMNGAIAGFIRGQGSLCLILGIFYAVGLSLIGLNFGLLIGLFAGLVSFIPFVGSILGLVLSVGVALVQFWPDFIWIAATAAIFFAGQFLEGNILQPKLIGDSVGLHPVWLMFALFAFGALMGFTGLLIAVPVAAALGVLVRFGVERYENSEFYMGSGKADETEEGEEAA
ncbi:MAG: AI-2E family transporter [Pseudomonadota bacterium]